MADTPVTYALRQAALATLFENQVASSINRAAVLFQLLRKVPADGKNITWNAKFGTAVPTTAAIADGVDVTNFDADDKIPATLNYATYHAAFAVTGLAEAAARIAGNPTQLTDLMTDELSDALDRLGAAIGRDIYWGTGSSNTMLGLLDPTAGAFIATGTHAGVDRSTYPQWAGNVVSGDNGRLQISKIRELNRKIKSASGKVPDFYIATPIVFDQIADALGAQRRFVQEVNLPTRGVIRLDGGYDLIDFDGKPIFSDVRLENTASATSGIFLAINSMETRLRYLPHPTAGTILRQAGIKVTAEPQLNSDATGLMGKIIELAQTGDKRKLGIFTYVQPQVRQCNANGMINAINELAA